MIKKYIYQGMTFTDNRKRLGFLFKELDDDKTLCWHERKDRNFVIGGIYEIETQEKKVFTSKIKYLNEEMKDEVYRKQLLVKDRTVRAEMDAMKQEERMASIKNDIGTLTLSELRNMAMFGTRSKIIAFVVTYLSK